MKVTVIQNGQARTVEAAAGQNLYKLLVEAGFAVDAPCGGNGLCGKCRVTVRPADAYTAKEEKVFSPEELAAGMRLACVTAVTRDVTVTLPQRGAAQIQIEGTAQSYPLAPRAQVKHYELPKPSVEDQTADLPRLERAAGQPLQADMGTLAHLADKLRTCGWKLPVTLMDGRMLDMEGGPVLGAAVDIGTTTVVAYLYDLADGKRLAVEACLNPQGVHGADVIARSDYASASPEGAQEMARLIRDAVNSLIAACCRQCGADSKRVCQVMLAGNTIMLHLFAGLPTRNITRAPFVPVYTRGTDMTAQEAGLTIHPKGTVTLMPCVAGYVGGDTVAAILAADMDRREDISLLVDIGTNGEIALGGKDWLITCSAAAGPAFEGAHIRCGMGGVSGAVNTVRVEGDKVVCTTIGNAPAKGICGSGLVDAIAALRAVEAIDDIGRLLDEDELEAEELIPRLREVDGKTAFLLAGKDEGAQADVVLCQKDVREVQLAKGAIAAGIQLLLKEAGIKVTQVDHLFLAGGFGSYIDKDSACAIGLLPKELRNKIETLGNAAGAGASMALLSKDAWQRAQSVYGRIQYLELSTRPDFQELFMDEMML